MEVICGLAGLVNWKHPGQGVRDIAASCFKQGLLDISLYFPADALAKKIENEKWLEERWKAIGILVHELKKQGVHTSLAYAPHFGYSAGNWPTLKVYRELVERSIRLCAEVQCQQIVVRPWQANLSRRELANENLLFYKSLAVSASEYGIEILLENQAKDIGGHLLRGLLSDASEAAWWLGELNEVSEASRFGFCLNMGASGPCGMNVYDLVHAVGQHLKIVMVNDSDATGEKQLLPFSGASRGTCETDWLNIIRSLREISFAGALVLNMRDTAAAFPPLLRPQLMELARSVMEYLLWQIDMEKNLARYSQRVLFGAGNMCRNYMSCYGELYPPLFTCDNNSKVWGTEVCGLAVHNPQDLRNLPEECAIFICNTYYREIEGQLREMGIMNPIEFFNDECLPMMYAGKLPREGI